MPHNPVSIVRLLYGERTADEKTAPKRFLLNPADNSLTSGLPIGQGHGLRGGGPVSISTDWQIPVILWETTSWLESLSGLKIAYLRLGDARRAVGSFPVPALLAGPPAKVNEAFDNHESAKFPRVYRDRDGKA